MSTIERPTRRTYVWDETKAEWVDARLVTRTIRTSTFIDPITKGRVYHNLGPDPIYINSRRELKRLLRERNLVEAG